MNIQSKIAEILPKSDPIVYLTHRYLVGHGTIEKKFNTGKKENAKFEEANGIDYSRSIYKRTMMQCGAILGAQMSFILGYISPVLHNLFHPFKVSYYSCLFLCLLTGHLIGMALGLGIATCTQGKYYPNVKE